MFGLWNCGITYWGDTVELWKTGITTMGMGTLTFCIDVTVASDNLRPPLDLPLAPWC